MNIYRHRWEEVIEIPFDTLRELAPGDLTITEQEDDCFAYDEYGYTQLFQCSRCGNYMLADHGGDYSVELGGSDECQVTLPKVADQDGREWFLYPEPSWIGHPPGSYQAYSAQAADVEYNHMCYFRIDEVAPEVQTILEAIAAK